MKPVLISFINNAVKKIAGDFPRVNKTPTMYKWNQYNEANFRWEKKVVM